MNRETLQNLLQSENPVAQQCAEAIARGAEFKIWEDESPAARLAAIYARRERTLQKTGQPTIGFAEAVDSIRRYSGESLLIGYVDDRPSGGYYFQLFIDPRAETLIACLAVRPSSEGGASSPPGHGQV